MALVSIRLSTILTRYHHLPPHADYCVIVLTVSYTILTEIILIGEKLVGQVKLLDEALDLEVTGLQETQGRECKKQFTQNRNTVMVPSRL